MLSKNGKSQQMDRRYALFLGCTVPVRALNYEISARKVAKRFGINLQHIPEFCCCGYPVKPLDHYAFLLMAARNLSLAEEQGLGICTLCSACCGALTEASHLIANDQKLRERLNRDLNNWLGRSYRGNIEVTHFIRILDQVVGGGTIREALRNDLSSLRLAPHYGCHYIKPTSIYGRSDDPENPRSLDRLIEALGAFPLSYEDRLLCCGGGVLALDETVALSMAGKKLDRINATGADAMVLICPFCSIMYESNQKKIEKIRGREYRLPVLFYTQILGLALGMSPDELGLKMNRVKPSELLKKINQKVC